MPDRSERRRDRRKAQRVITIARRTRRSRISLTICVVAVVVLAAVVIGGVQYEKHGEAEAARDVVKMSAQTNVSGDALPVQSGSGSDAARRHGSVHAWRPRV
ncbi:hypothetical protein Atai01_46700 [Amycolatopsis taiwanensis]|uniref:Uncharacterized protein n=1 Tax=Amycolatopsis taiwanensis TaxID=342230 RepID=A0A9W6R1Z1_9PSEU|nr:hypothetical protein Atai01_46700 [Amycolatopsis taiwanensis]